MKHSRIYVGLFAIALLLGACSKYDEGPAFSLYSKAKRVQGYWYFTSVKHNDVDSSEHYINGRIEFLVDTKADEEWGLFTWIKYPQATQQNDDNVALGGWKFIGDKDSVQMVFVAEHIADFDTINWKINRLTYNEWWLEHIREDSTKVRWELWKWVY